MYSEASSLFHGRAVLQDLIAELICYGNEASSPFSQLSRILSFVSVFATVGRTFLTIIPDQTIDDLSPVFVLTSWLTDKCIEIFPAVKEEEIFLVSETSPTSDIISASGSF